MKERVISFEDFSYKYKIQTEATLQDINLNIYAGERVIIVGPSGCGKSTLAHCLNGLNPFSYLGEYEGSLKICGIETKHSSIFELSNYVGTVLQDTDGQFIGMTVLEDIAFAMENDMVSQEELLSRTMEEAKKVDLLDKLHFAPHELSGGQKQRVSLAGILVGKTPILLFDEPLANLDPAAGKEAIKLIDTIQKDHDVTVVIIEHRLEDALYMGADRIIVMQDGRIISDDTPSKIFASNVLVKAGIREPLFISALKYAGVSLEGKESISRIQELQLSDQEIMQVKTWFLNELCEKQDKKFDQILNVSNLSFGYKEDITNLEEVNFSVYRGEMLGIVGKNGAGKSTLAKLLCGFEHPNKGTLFLHGNNMEEQTIKERAGFIGYVMQNPNQMISKPMIFEEVAMSLLDKGFTDEEIREKVHDTLKICGLYPFRNWPISALSYGQKKRVTIASILVQNPEILILDEPTAGQDYRHYTEIMEFLTKLNKKGITVMMITHDMHLLLEYTTRCLVFSKGKLLDTITPVELFANLPLLKQASLKETSLYDLAKMCGLKEEEFIYKFIQLDRQIQNKEEV
ncbi:MAG: ABC transporter ATP-binding protein [Lachnospiraceae bacterium]